MMSLKGTGEGGHVPATNEQTNSHNYCYFAKMDKKNKVESKSDKQGME